MPLDESFLTSEKNVFNMITPTNLFTKISYVTNRGGGERKVRTMPNFAFLLIFFTYLFLTFCVANSFSKVDKKFKTIKLEKSGFAKK